MYRKIGTFRIFGIFRVFRSFESFGGFRSLGNFGGLGGFGDSGILFGVLGTRGFVIHPTGNVQQISGVKRNYTGITKKKLFCSKLKIAKKKQNKSSNLSLSPLPSSPLSLSLLPHLPLLTGKSSYWALKLNDQTPPPRSISLPLFPLPPLPSPPPLLAEKAG
jgi:hypothetical protein